MKTRKCAYLCDCQKFKMFVISYAAPHALLKRRIVEFYAKTRAVMLTLYRNIEKCFRQKRKFDQQNSITDSFEAQLNIAVHVNRIPRFTQIRDSKNKM